MWLDALNLKNKRQCSVLCVKIQMFGLENGKTNSISKYYKLVWIFLWLCCNTEIQLNIIVTSVHVCWKWNSDMNKRLWTWIINDECVKINPKQTFLAVKIPCNMDYIIYPTVTSASPHWWLKWLATICRQIMYSFSLIKIFACTLKFHREYFWSFHWW